MSGCSGSRALVGRNGLGSLKEVLDVTVNLGGVARSGVEQARTRRALASFAAIALAGVVGLGTALAPSPLAAQGRASVASGFADLAEKLLPSVVNISTTQVLRAE